MFKFENKQIKKQFFSKHKFLDLFYLLFKYLEVNYFIIFKYYYCHIIYIRTSITFTILKFLQQKIIVSNILFSIYFLSTMFYKINYLNYNMNKQNSSNQQTEVSEYKDCNEMILTFEMLCPEIQPPTQSSIKRKRRSSPILLN